MGILESKSFLIANIILHTVVTTTHQILPKTKADFFPC
jgi:hypothetical protein